MFLAHTEQLEIILKNFYFIHAFIYVVCAFTGVCVHVCMCVAMCAMARVGSLFVLCGSQGENSCCSQLEPDASVWIGGIRVLFSSTQI